MTRDQHKGLSRAGWPFMSSLPLHSTADVGGVVAPASVGAGGDTSVAQASADSAAGLLGLGGVGHCVVPRASLPRDAGFVDPVAYGGLRDSVDDVHHEREEQYEDQHRDERLSLHFEFHGAHKAGVHTGSSCADFAPSLPRCYSDLARAAVAEFRQDWPDLAAQLDAMRRAA